VYSMFTRWRLTARAGTPSRPPGLSAPSPSPGHAEGVIPSGTSGFDLHKKSPAAIYQMNAASP